MGCKKWQEEGPHGPYKQCKNLRFYKFKKSHRIIKGACYDLNCL